MRPALLILVLALLVEPVSAQDYELVWQDEFDGIALDTSKWEAQLGTGCPDLCGWGNNELQFYRSENATVANGLLTITAKEEQFANRDFTSARLRTRLQGDWTYGRFEMRAKMPIGQGLWPAFWMLPTDFEYGGWAASGEIDIVEYLGQDRDRILGTIHFGGPFPANTFSSREFTLPTGGSFHNIFHEFALEWEPCEMRWYVDGLLYATQKSWYSTNGAYPAPFDKRFHLLLNFAVGGNLPGSPDETTQFPQELVVDYVRVYQKPDFRDCVTIFDGMDHANPFANEWFEFNGSVGGGGIGPNIADLPPIESCRAALQSGWGSGGSPGFFGGFGRRNLTDLTGSTHFSFWINPDAGQEYSLEINLQDDDNGDGVIPVSPDGADDEWQAVVTVGPAGSDVSAGGGWQRLSIPLTDFVDDGSFHFGGNGVFDPFPTSGGGNGELINVLWVVMGTSGSDASFRTDQWVFTRQTGSIAGRVFSDLDSSGSDDGEPGIPNVGVELFDVALAEVIATSTTDGNGGYFFPQLLGALYEVRVDPALIPTETVPSFDPDGARTPGVFSTELACDAALSQQDFGYAPLTVGAPPSGRFQRLAPNVPNPFNPSTSISFELPVAMQVRLEVFDVAGRRVRTLVSGEREAGSHEVVWDGRDSDARPLASGVFYYTLITPTDRETRRMVLLK